jgi:enamine deaminase RidA (YjgF/YER057c/UK114 family)
MSNIIHISGEGLSLPNGHYSSGVILNNTIYVSATLPPTNCSASEHYIEEQVQGVLQQIIEVVSAGGGLKDTIAHIRIYTTDLKYWPLIDASYSRIMGSCRPARSIICVNQIKGGWLICAEAIAGISTQTEYQTID